MAAMDATERRLAIRTRTDDAGQVLITVEDSGPGFDPATLDQVFDPFFTTRAEGMGMGLAICRSIIEAHAGHIAAGNRPESGARVTVTFPTVKPPRTTASATSQVNAPSAERSRSQRAREPG
jgi:signal transduction histidine kinase